jgi:hypothetical protein
MATEIKAPKMNVIPDKKMIKDDVVMDGKGNSKREIDPRPQFSINAEEFPAIADWSVGKKYKIEIEVEMTGCRIGEWGDDKGKMTGEFKICGIMADEDKDDAKEEKASSFPKGMSKGKK